jgi:AcrR family transcriptional regulator
VTGPNASQRPYHHGDLPAALLDAVAGTIETDGLEAVSLRAVARRAGVSHAAPAHHFGDKAGLLAAFATQGFEAFTAALEDARAGVDGTPAERFEAMGRAYLRFAEEHRPWFEVMFRPELMPGHVDHVHLAGSGSFSLLVDQLARCLVPDAPEDEVVALAFGTWAAVHGMATLRVDGPLTKMGVSGDEAVRAVLDFVLARLRAHPGWRGDDAT